MNIIICSIVIRDEFKDEDDDYKDELAMTFGGVLTMFIFYLPLAFINAPILPININLSGVMTAITIFQFFIILLAILAQKD